MSARVAPYQLAAGTASGLHLQVVADDADSVRHELPLGRSAETAPVATSNWLP